MIHGAFPQVHALSAPPLWKTLTGPTHWFTLRHPEGWKVEESDGSLRLSPPGEQGALIITCLRVPPGQADEFSSSLDPRTLFPRCRRVRKLKPLDLPYQTLCLEGERELDEEGQTWWKRLWRGSHWTRWRAWCISHEELHLLAIWVETSGRDPEMETLSAMILNTVEMADNPADSPDQFAERVIALARRKFPLLACRKEADFHIKMGESSVSLFNFYRAYLNAPDRFEDIVLPALTTVVQVQEWGSNQTDPPLETVRDRIMPMLYPEEAWKKNFPNFLGTPWVAGLMVLYVLDESNAYWYVRKDLSRKWGLSVEQLHDIALANLETYFEQKPAEFACGGVGESARIVMPMRPDAYITARWLSPSFRASMQKEIGREIAVGLPGRDFFVAISTCESETLQQMKGLIAADFDRIDHPLTNRMLLVSRDGVSELCEDAALEDVEGHDSELKDE